MYKVLLVDQNIHSRERTEQMLDWSLLGFAIQANADNSVEAISLFDQQQFSLVLINVNRFQSSGMLLCEHIRKKSRVPIILIGGNDDFQLARKALAYHVSDYLPDPVQPHDLIASLKTVKRELDSKYVVNFKSLSLSAVNFQRKHQPSKSIIDKVKKYVEEELHQNITLKKISDMLHFNCAYLGQKFKNHEHMSFNEYLLQQRMEKAKVLLENTEMKVYEIANEVGYSEIDWFYKKFKEYTGVSANEYRKMITYTA